MLLNLPKSPTLISSNLHPTGTILYFVLSSLEIFTLTLTVFYVVLPHHISVSFVLLFYSYTLKVNRNCSILYLEMQHWLTVFVVLYSNVSRCLADCPKDPHSQRICLSFGFKMTANYIFYFFFILQLNPGNRTCFTCDGTKYHQVTYQLI